MTGMFGIPRMTWINSRADKNGQQFASHDDRPNIF